MKSILIQLLNFIKLNIQTISYQIIFNIFCKLLWLGLYINFILKVSSLFSFNGSFVCELYDICFRKNITTRFFMKNGMVLQRRINDCYCFHWLYLKKYKLNSFYVSKTSIISYRIFNSIFRHINI